MTFLERFFIPCICCILALSACSKLTVEPRFDDIFLKYYGEEGKQFGVDVDTINNGFVILGNTIGTGQVQKGLVITSDNQGNEIWSRSFGGDQKRVDAVDVEVDQAGNFVVLANIDISTTDRDFLLVKLSPEGNLIDSLVIGNVGFEDQASQLLVTSSGDYIAIGTTSNVDLLKPGYDETTDFEDIYSVRITEQFAIKSESSWRKITGFPGIDKGVGISESEGGFLVYGTTDRPNSNNEQDQLNMFAYAANQEGIPTSLTPFQWFGTKSNERASALFKTSVSEHIMIGTSSDDSRPDQVYITVLGNGNLFEKSFTLNSEESIEGVSISESVNGGYIITGNKATTSGSLIYLAEVSNDGAIKWTRNYGGSDENLASKVMQLKTGEIIIVGTVELGSQTKITLIKTNNQGELKP